ncbi:MAG: hypothetical protein AAGD35_21000 [Actinomycetota bacterium]
MATIADDLPVIDGHVPIRYSAVVDQFGVRLSLSSEADGAARDVAVALADAFPSGRYGQADDPVFSDTLESYAIEVPCGDGVDCRYEVADDRQLEGTSRTSLLMSYSPR